MIADPSLSLALFAVLLALASAAVAPLAGRRPRLLRRGAVPLLGMAGAMALVAGLWTLSAGTSASAILPLGLPWLPWHVRLDPLAAVFLVLIGLVTTAVGFYGRDYVRDFERGRDSLTALGGFSGLFLAGMLLVVLADDAFVFMVAWELMSLASYFLVAFQHEQAANRRAAFLYLLMAHIGGLAILLGFGVLAGFGGGFDFASLRAAELSPLWAGVAFALALLGFGMKAGLVPLHAWLPEAHPVAPSHISALMSGVMLKVAVYGFIRVVFDLNGAVHWSWGVALIGIGGLSALVGVLFALMQTDLKRLLAYSSVENLGIIFIALGLALLFQATAHSNLAALALVAALYHALNHALFKSLLFLGAGAILHSTHERDLDQMGGLLRRMPWTGSFFLIGCLSISALPPFNGFVSEWLIFQAALQAWNLDSGVLRSLVPIASAVLALTGALVAATFVKVYGIAFLGQARSRHVRRARPSPRGMWVGQGLLAAFCVLFGVLPTQILSLLDPIAVQLLGNGVPQADAGGWLWLTPISAETASYSAPLTILLLALIAGAAILWFRRRTSWRVRRCDPWDCGFAPPTPRMQYTAASFAQPIRRVFALLFVIDEAQETGADGVTRYRLKITDRTWGWLYLPLARTVDSASRQVARLQSGSVRVYLGWTLMTLLVLLWIIAL
ncbi:Formate hydrogenlyase subunit 3/Multisubunit Na+/H+ antiporter, MnhD subunit [Allochromatium warmingii]|uniref:Formate hydrogenlyase subunit 3/Multisubunit Na+/H+ antiporter, MnhD subunit n=1 Tax=Allochromatium warmingii TaxID=61595 RepID=A0A1H3DQ96_ALLWA|nr:hydrogenase 4 subunit B [Allochromatium warmingii]SDX67854.1 Formate hydrogenlyase subunit 3/Multisubunit Na+/H+ antiporter, MnhD subunit [Allochromatium warmingii]